jgi:hypothetical protein
MKRVSLDRQPPAIKKFIRKLPIQSEGVELELDGAVICRVFPSTGISESQKQALVKDRWQIIRRAQKRNRRVPTEVLEREVQASVEEVRRRKRK